jgi:hypothetical protein
LSGGDACLALGVLGDSLAIPRLLEGLRHPLTADAAACALEILLGAAPLGTRLEPDVDDRAPARTVPSVSLDPEAWRALADTVLARHPGGSRLRAGTLASVGATVTLLGRLHLPFRVRRYLAQELSVRWQVRHGFDVHALLRQQQQALAAIPAPALGTPGSWG